MPWIRVTDTAPAGVTGVISINPKAMEAVGNVIRSISFGSSALTRVQEESIATVVSVANKCRY
ncbi:MAG: hypothetical protein HYU29_06060 [Chloroflexi bacterium]|nr:hypothetical protein [Chloroflexota bacterium]